MSESIVPTDTAKEPSGSIEPAESIGAAASTEPGTSKLRAIAVGMLGLLAIVGLFATTLTVWTNRVVFNSDKVAGAVEAALVEPEVNAALATYLTDGVFTLVDVDQFVESVLPSELQRLSLAISGGTRGFVNTRIQAVLAREDVQNLITELVRRSHASLMRLLEGDGLVAGISVDTGAITINLLPLIGRGLEQVQQLGLFDDVVIPELTRDGDPAQQAAALGAAFGRTLPPNFGQLLVFNSEALAKADSSVNAAQRIMVIAKRAIWLTPMITLLALIATIALAQRRRRAILILALSGLAVMLLARVVIQRFVGLVPDLVTSEGARSALAASVGSLSRGLLRLTTVIAVIAVIAALAAFFTGDSSTATSVRGRLGAGNTSLAGAVSEHRDLFAFSLFGAAVLVIVLLGIGVLSLLVALVLAIGGAAVLWGPDRSPASP